MQIRKNLNDSERLNANSEYFRLKETEDLVKTGLNQMSMNPYLLVKKCPN